jgi:hypothetical protein
MLGMLGVALLSSCAGAVGEATPSLLSADPSATLDPAVMAVAPQKARPGEIVSVTFTEAIDRGILYAVEEASSGGWQRLHLMISDANGDEPTWFGEGDEVAVAAVGVGGLGPDHVPIPDALAPGAYRICTANAVENICTPIEVIGR